MDNPDMISPDERFSIALDVLKRLKAELAAQKAAQSAAQAAQETGFTPAAPAGSRLEYALAGTPAGQPDTLTLQGYLKGHASLPPHSAVLGAGEDGLPFLLDLVDATPGALLVLEDEAEEARRLLRTLLTSASLLNPPRELDLRLVTARPEAYSAVRRQTAFKQAASPLERAAGHMVSELAALAERAAAGDECDPGYRRPAGPGAKLPVQGAQSADRSGPERSAGGRVDGGGRQPRPGGGAGAHAGGELQHAHHRAG